jgi:hypothetical protein
VCSVELGHWRKRVESGVRVMITKSRGIVERLERIALLFRD